VFRAMTGRKGRVGGGASGPPVALVRLGAPVGALRPPGQRLSRRKTAAVGVTTAPRRPPRRLGKAFRSPPGRRCGGRPRFRRAQRNLRVRWAAGPPGFGPSGAPKPGDFRGRSGGRPPGGGPMPVQLESSPGWPQFPTEG
jgi:hypothetical protein